MNLRSIDTNLVLALHALLTRRNVTRAGRDVGLSQSSMSHALGRLRAHFDDPLLVRVGRELVMTERAKSLVGPVAEAVGGLERVFGGGAERFDPKTSRRVFRIAATDNVELYVLPKLAAALQKKAPGITLRVGALPADWPSALKRGDIDLKLGRKYTLPAGLVGQDLSEEALACVVRRGHRVRSAPSFAALAALDHLVVMPSGALGAEPAGAVDAALAKRGLERRVAMTVPHFLVAPFIVASSDLVLTAPERMLRPFVETLRLRRLALPFDVPGYTLSQVWAARADDDEGHQWLRATLARAFR